MQVDARQCCRSLPNVGPVCERIPFPAALAIASRTLQVDELMIGSRMPKCGTLHVVDRMSLARRFFIADVQSEFSGVQLVNALGRS